MMDNSFQGRVYLNSTPTAGATGTSEQTIMTYSLPVKSLCVNGQGLRIRTSWLHAANTNAATVKLYFGATSLSSGANSTSGATGSLDMEVYRNGDAAQLVIARGQTATTPLASVATSGTDDLTGAITIKATITGGTTGADATVNYLSVEFCQAA